MKLMKHTFTLFLIALLLVSFTQFLEDLSAPKDNVVDFSNYKRRREEGGTKYEP